MGTQEHLSNHSIAVHNSLEGSCSVVQSSGDNVSLNHSLHNQISNEKSIKAFPMSQINSLLKHIDDDVMPLDIKLSLYIAACEAVSEGISLHPYPPGFEPSEEFELDTLFAINKEIPTTDVIKIFLQSPHQYKLSPNTLNILHWILVLLKEPKLESVLPEEFERKLLKVSNQVVSKPTYMFTLKYSVNSHFEMKWQAVKNNSATKFAYFSTKAHHFHSLLHYGFHAISNYTGPRILLSEDLNFLLSKDFEGWTWGKSCIGSNILMVALVEYINDPTDLYKGEEMDHQCNKTIDKRFFLLTNPEHVRIRHLMVYVNEGAPGLRIPRTWILSGHISSASTNLVISVILILALFSIKRPESSALHRFFNFILEHTQKVKFW